MMVSPDNWDTDEMMADSELVVMSQIIELLFVAVGTPNKTLEQVFMAHLRQHESSVWQDVNLITFIDVAKQISLPAMNFLMAFATKIADSQKFTVASDVFKQILGATTFGCQWVRVAFFCRAYGADWAKEADNIKRQIAAKRF